MTTRKTFPEVVTEFPSRAAVVTPNDTTEFEPSTIWCNDAGDVAVQPAEPPSATAVTFVMEAGQAVPVQVRKVLSTGTTAADLVRIW